MEGQKLPNTTATDELKDVEEQAFFQVNTLLLHDLGAKIKAYPSIDMTDLLEQKLRTYPALRKAFRDSAVQSAISALDSSDNTAAAAPVDVREDFRIPADVIVIRPLSATVTQAVQTDSYKTGPDLSAIIEGLNRLLPLSEVVWHLGSTAVLGLDSALVMKVGYDIDIDHLPTLDYIKQQAPRVPIPDIHGILQQPGSKRIFLFMSRVSGEPLDSIWKSLGEGQKASIREQLDAIIDDFRSIPAPPTKEADAVFGGGNPRRCKDARRQVRVAERPINNENEFNQFLTSNPLRVETSNAAMVRSYLETNHKLVMTHGDLHPRNIMVAVTPQPLRQNGSDTLSQELLNITSNTSSLPTAHVAIKAILDWEMCGWYPEYWEYVKALNTITPGDGLDDWWAYLPRKIGVWPKEHAVDLMLSRWHG